MKKNGYQKYKKTSVESASREKLLLLMYEGAIKFTKRSIMACESGDIAERGQNIGRAYDIILELMNTLNHDLGGDVASNLEQLYMFIIDQYTKANLSGETKPLKDALQILETLHQGWIEAIEKLKKEESGSGENSNMGSRTA
ncbi:MAG: flagellar export chaperone FliS [Bdellovibrionales bacterium]|nr:flagellar export chaperone FliS [Bdellovibrionales bacterium]